MRHPIRTLGFAVLVSLAVCTLPAIANATPSATAPAAGAFVPYNSQVFSWTDNYAQGPIDHWYLEISTSPSVDYYYFGFFNEGLVFTSGDIWTTSVNLNSLGQALAPGTYYWHVVGFYGAYGGLGTAWTTVRSFTVQGSAVVAPAIAVSPASFYFSAKAGTTGWLPTQLLRISNKGGGTLDFTATAPQTSWCPVFGQWASDGQIVTIQVSCWPNGLATGRYQANITITDRASSPPCSNDPVFVPVILDILPGETVAPTGCSVSINAGAPATNNRQVTLDLAATDVGSGMGEMRFDNNDNSWSEWYDYAPKQTWVLTSGNGTKTVRAQFRDKLGNASGAVSDTISLNTSLVIAPVTPVAGTDRISTAIAASKLAFPSGAGTVVIATAYNWPDALGGSALAGALHGPILLTSPTSLSDGMAAEIARLHATKAIILGGTGAVSASVASALDALPNVTIERISGANRYETARKIASRTVNVWGPGYDGTAFVATGANFPDALGASPLAAAKGWPIYLADPAAGNNASLASAMDAAGVAKALVLGGPSVVSASTQAKLAQVLGSASRLNGADRFATAVVVASFGVNTAGLHWDKLAIATGQNFPDALAGGVLEGESGSVMLLTPSAVLYPGVASTLSANKTSIDEVRFLGGIGAVSNAVRTAVVNALH